MKKRIDVREQGVADSHRCAARFCHGGPAIGFLREGAEGVVVAVEGEEGAELHPARAKLVVCVSVKATGGG